MQELGKVHMCTRLHIARPQCDTFHAAKGLPCPTKSLYSHKYRAYGAQLRKSHRVSTSVLGSHLAPRAMPSEPAMARLVAPLFLSFIGAAARPWRAIAGVALEVRRRPGAEVKASLTSAAPRMRAAPSANLDIDIFSVYRGRMVRSPPGTQVQIHVSTPTGWHDV